MRRPGITFHAHQYPQGGKFKQEMRTAIAHKRQRDAGHRQEPQIHADIYEYMTHEKNSNTHAEKYFEIICSESGRVEYPPDNGYIKSEDKQRADEAPFFGICGENEVRLRLRQKFQPRLRAET